MRHLPLAALLLLCAASLPGAGLADFLPQSLRPSASPAASEDPSSPPDTGALPLPSAVDTTAAAPADSSVTPAPRTETCKEMYEKLKNSDCARPVARFLEGASVIVGVAFNSGHMQIDSKDTLLAAMVGIMVPAPYFSFSLPKSYIGRSPWGYELSFNYTSSIAVYQNLADGGPQVLRDLGTYAAITFLSVSPSIYVDVGGRDRTPDEYWRFGLGFGAGWASVRGESYHTLDGRTPERAACHDAADALQAGAITEKEFRGLCEPHSFKQRGLGLSAGGFTDVRWRFLYGKLSVGGLAVAGGRYDYKPLEISIKLAYIQDL